MMRDYLLTSCFLRPCVENLLGQLGLPAALWTLPTLAGGAGAAAAAHPPADCGRILAPEGAALLGEEPVAAPVPLVLPRVHNGAALLLGDGAKYRQLYGQGVLGWMLPGWERPVVFGPAGDCRCLGLLVDTQLGLPDGELAARAAARRQGWDLLLLEADYRLLAGFLTGELPASQLVVTAPGQPLARSYDRSLLMAG